MMPPQQVQAAYLKACDLDVAAPKPGNVSDYAPGHDMDAEVFRISAQASAPPLANPNASLGERVLTAVTASQNSVNCNSNLGIILLCAPIAQAAFSGCKRTLRESLLDVLEKTTVDDAQKVYRAIRLATPGGLGASPEHDVANTPHVDLRTAMARAISWDQIAGEYASGFAGLWDRVLPHLDAALARWKYDLLRATTDLYLALLAEEPDTHVRRRHGDHAARQLCHQAELMRRIFLNFKDPVKVDHALQCMDLRMKAARINPGTTADLVVAGHFLAQLHAPGAEFAGMRPGHTRVAQDFLRKPAQRF